MNGASALAARRRVRHPVRIAHLGLGAFHRAHQAWYTQLANDLGGDWGIAAFTGRTAAAAAALQAQDCVYTLLTRRPVEDTATLVESISSAHDGADLPAWRAVLSDPDVVVLTMTVTEAGYRLNHAGDLDEADPRVGADLELLRRSGDRAPETAIGRIVDGLRARRQAGAGPIAIVSCDNLPGNGEVTRRAVLAAATAVDRDLAGWIEASVSFVSTMVDRITPAASDGDRLTVRELTGVADSVPVVTEEFSEWVLSGEFPGGRPDWHLVGARFVADVTPFEQRKLWFLNAAHSLLAYCGLDAGFSTVSQAFADAGCRGLVEQLWDEARPLLDLPSGEMDEWLEQLRMRWSNPRIEHRLVQIGADGSQKLPLRILEVARRRRAAGLATGVAGAAAIAAWVRYLERGDGARYDPAATGLAAELRGMTAAQQATAAVAFLGPGDREDPGLIAAITKRLEGALT
ncbi:MAG: fructuronate reductase [Microbacteriaceae bacterium]|nr:fructuronate reductase [Microbacteriaceae bacterium]